MSSLVALFISFFSTSAIAQAPPGLIAQTLLETALDTATPAAPPTAKDPVFIYNCYANDRSDISTVQVSEDTRRALLRISLRNGRVFDLEAYAGWQAPNRYTLGAQRRIDTAWTTLGEEVLVVVKTGIHPPHEGSITFWRDSLVTNTCEQLLKQTVFLRCNKFGEGVP